MIWSHRSRVLAVPDHRGATTSTARHTPSPKTPRQHSQPGNPRATSARGRLRDSPEVHEVNKSHDLCMDPGVSANSTNTSDIADNNNFDGPETVNLAGAAAFQISGSCTWYKVG